MVGFINSTPHHRPQNQLLSHPTLPPFPISSTREVITFNRRTDRSQPKFNFLDEAIFDLDRELFFNLIDDYLCLTWRSLAWSSLITAMRQIKNGESDNSGFVLLLRLRDEPTISRKEC